MPRLIAPCAKRCAASTRIKGLYALLHRLLRQEGSEIAALKVEDLRDSRLVVCDPAPIPLDELQRTYAWLKSWGMLEETASPLQLVDLQVQTHAHVTAHVAAE